MTKTARLTLAIKVSRPKKVWDKDAAFHRYYSQYISKKDWKDGSKGESNGNKDRKLNYILSYLPIII